MKIYEKFKKVSKKSQKRLFFGTPNNTLILGSVLVGPKTK
jgi:hypothetical protein